ncbi:AAA domain-containing protein, putative AbiEii toxin, Type IV TA system [Eubacterium maltosivorans]|uniref:AAA family ATPase n=1 Tax=Eubacterium maltosivorans TaxID=2041044 RepID=UPI00088F4B2E|nr:AAA family ATPase [Eubacterium maltosivorans]WPK79758.1 hypothetical protein EUMA32_11670 [Eubacterium maltosivorans]SDP02696.1 AAA domain-containing protein, putative AbiEii toxin, Type IV TA system [Eubacterium maltosivorans]
MDKNITKLKKIRVVKFRGLENITVNFGDRITVICGKNGTSKSTILGIIAQAFSFRTDYSKGGDGKDILKDFRTLTDNTFESTFGEHFRFSTKYDKPGDMSVYFHIHDGASKKDMDNLELKIYDYKDRELPRPVLRGFDSHNVTHPIIYLSLERLLPITKRKKYTETKIEYIENHKKDIVDWNRRILSKYGVSNVAATVGTMNSMVIHGKDYDKESVSVGEDNIGQILEAILSFQYLQDQYVDYHGGILLIDEADAGMFPAAQLNFVSFLSKITKKLNLQVILTSHSPTMVQSIYDLRENDQKLYEVVYLTDSYGKINTIKNPSWAEIEADLRIETIKVNSTEKLPKINVYFEDSEAYSFYKSLVTKRSITKILQPMKNVTLGCDQYISLYNAKIPEFYKESIIVLDGDQEDNTKKGGKTIINLPGPLPPDQLLFEFLYKLPANDPFWINHPLKFNRNVFLRISENILSLLNLDGYACENFCLSSVIEAYCTTQKDYGGKIREAFKNFYKNEELQKIITTNIHTNPFRLWSRMNRQKVAEFNDKFEILVKKTLIRKGVPKYLVESYFHSI